MRSRKVLIVDDHQIVRRGVAAIVATRPEWTVCGEASTGREAIAAAAQLRPDIIVMDIAMPEMNGLEATRQIKASQPETEVLILSMHESSQLVHDVLASGARGYVLKADAGTDLTAALEALGRHQPYFAPKIADVVLSGFLAGRRTEEPESAPEISSREREILQLIAEGKTNKDVANLLTISVKTVETHRANIMDKLGLHSLSELVRYAIRNKIIEC